MEVTSDRLLFSKTKSISRHLSSNGLCFSYLLLENNLHEGQKSVMTKFSDSNFHGF